MATDLELYYGSIRIGSIEDAFYSDDTGYGIYRLSDGDDPDDPGKRRVREYIAFSEDWHARYKKNEAFEDSEWDAFQDVTASRLWRTLSREGVASPMDGPVFVEGEISWRTKVG